MVELHCHSCFSFLDGASHPEELVRRAVELGYTALALTDHNGLYGSMEFAQAARESGLQAITGAEITLEDGCHLTLLAETPEGYANLCRLISHAHRDHERLDPQVEYAVLAQHTAGLIALSGCRNGEVSRLVLEGRLLEAERAALRYLEWFGAGSFFLEAQQNLVRGDTERLRLLAQLSEQTGIPLVATNNTHYHIRERHRLQDTLVAIKHGMSLDDAHRYRRPNSEFALKHPDTLRVRFRRYPQALENARIIAERCRSFDITQDLGYTFPDFIQEAEDHQFLSADEALKLLCEEALEVKYAHCTPERQEEARRWLKEELRLVRFHNLAGFFLVYRDLLQLSKQVAAEIRGQSARGRFELPPGRGRGSAVSSIICYLIGLSPVDPVQAKLFPGRFLNESLTSVPDIDLDFPRDIREELIKRVHEHYGHDHVGMVCIFPTYRFRGAVREVGKALALPPAELDRLARLGDNYTHVGVEMERLAEFSRYGENPLWKHLQELSEQLWGMPRHISQHVGGLIISSRPLIEVVPIEKAAMDGRQLCQWDKDSCDTARFIKIDFLALGMLSAVEECLELIEGNDKPPVDLSRIDFEDPVVYNRICRGETLGAFQIESRAQIGMLVRTRPRCIEDLAVQVAIVRPGPIVGNAVNPYVRQRELQRTTPNFRPQMDHELLRPVLEDTLGVIIYQDQVMEVCKALAGFTDGQADQLRRAMSRKRSRENMERFRTLFLEGAAGKGVPEEIAVRVFEKVVAFSEFGFPKSHAAAFAILAYQSMWLLHYHPAEFIASVINSMPMGFYSPDTLIKDTRRRGVTFLNPDINLSQLGCTVKGNTVRLGLEFVRQMGEVKTRDLLWERERNGPFQGLRDLILRTRLPDSSLECLIHAGALDSFGLHRRELLWQLGLLTQYRGISYRPPTSNEQRATSNSAISQSTLALPTDQDQVTLARASRWERMSREYAAMGLSTAEHPVQLLRPLLRAMPPPGPPIPIGRLRQCEDQSQVAIAGLVTTRQRPQTAKGILFLLMEDEGGMVNVVVRRELYEASRELFRTEPLIVVQGILECRSGRLNLVAEEAWPLRDFLPDVVKEGPAQRVHAALNAWKAPPSHNYR